MELKRSEITLPSGVIWSGRSGRALKDWFNYPGKFDGLMVPRKLDFKLYAVDIPKPPLVNWENRHEQILAAWSGVYTWITGKKCMLSYNNSIATHALIDAAAMFLLEANCAPAEWIYNSVLVYRKHVSSFGLPAPNWLLSGKRLSWYVHKVAGNLAYVRVQTTRSFDLVRQIYVQMEFDLQEIRSTTEAQRIAEAAFPGETWHVLRDRAAKEAVELREWLVTAIENGTFVWGIYGKSI